MNLNSEGVGVKNKLHIIFFKNSKRKDKKQNIFRTTHVVTNFWVILVEGLKNEERLQISNFKLICIILISHFKDLTWLIWNNTIRFIHYIWGISFDWSKGRVNICPLIRYQVQTMLSIFIVHVIIHFVI